MKRHGFPRAGGRTQPSSGAAVPAAAVLQASRLQVRDLPGGTPGRLRRARTPAPLFSTVLVLVWLLVALTAPAFVLRFDGAGNPLRWNLAATNTANHTNVFNPNTLAIRYFLASDAWSATNTAAELNAVRAAFAQWQ